MGGGETGSGGWNCLGRAEVSLLWLWWLVGVCRIALPGQNHPPGTGTPSGAEKVTKHPPAPTKGVGACVSGGLRLVNVMVVECKM